ncbi:hypothetical protein AB0L57_30135 [Nocardia sp. NPDC052254]|uniref:hypothetical protein n=1 Tax=Nocardia sp. NPDC052254 TaxID=3155681 RepID=UPI00344307BA
MNSAWLLTLLPGWVLLGLLVISGLVTAIMFIALMAGGSASDLSSDFRYQCDSAVGPDTESTETETTTSARNGVRETQEQPPASDVPTTNPYAEMTVDPGDSSVSQWQRDCVSAMASAPYQLPESQMINSSAAANCARQLAGAQIGQPAGTGGAATLVRNVIYQASAVDSTGHCGLLGAAPGDAAATSGGAGTDLAPAAGSCGSTTQIPGETARTVVVLPETVAAQGVCGQRVDPAAASSGDLVFWDYQRHAPSRVGIVIGSEVMVTVDPATGGVVESVIPSGSAVRVKRVLGSSS